MDREIYQWAKRTDGDRIFQHQDGGCNTRENADFFTPNGYGLASSVVPWAPGTFDALRVPFVAHEFLNLGIKLDPRLAPKFTGAIPSPRSLADYETSLKAAGLDRAWGDACLDAAHALQGHYQKAGIEQARLDPACDGYAYWTMVDVMVPQAGTYTGQGLGNQVGTAFARHPVFGDFPHDGKLSPLWFRLIKRGLPLPIDPKFGAFHHFAVGEGQQQYFTYICQKQEQNGHRLLITRGVDLLADTPEGAYLLDAMIDYARSDAFASSQDAKYGGSSGQTE